MNEFADEMIPTNTGTFYVYEIFHCLCCSTRPEYTCNQTSYTHYVLAVQV